MFAIVIGELQEKEQARNTYEDAIASGHGAYLLEQNSTKAFTASIGNFPPGKEVLITLVYVTELTFNEDGQLRLVLPEQGYAPNGTDSLQFPAPSTSDSRLYSKAVAAGLTMEIEFDMTSKISQITSESHPKLMNVDINAVDERRALVRVPTTANPLMHNFELIIQLENSADLVARTQRNAKGERIVMVAFHPRLKDVEPLGEILFLVDRSGSMMGSKMTKTIETMQIFLRSLSPGVIFNVVSFGSSFSTLFKTSQPYDDTTLATASDLVKGMSANMGGTEILRPLKAIFSDKPDPKYPRQLFILTDGEVSDTTECVRICRRNASNTRVFCFGIGSGASQSLCEGMAKAANGDFEMIKDSDSIHDKVLKQLNTALLPAITNIKLTWGDGAASRVSPSRFATVFAGSLVIAYAWLTPNEEATTLFVRFTATTPTEDLDISRQVDLTKPADGTYLFALAAKRLFTEISESASFAHDDGGAFLPGWDFARLNKVQIDLSLETQVLCPLTAFVAVEERQDPTQGNAILRRVVEGSRGLKRGRARNGHGESDEEDDGATWSYSGSRGRGGRGGRGGGGGFGGRGGRGSVNTGPSSGWRVGGSYGGADSQPAARGGSRGGRGGSSGATKKQKIYMDSMDWSRSRSSSDSDEEKKKEAERGRPKKRARNAKGGNDAMDVDGDDDYDRTEMDLNAPSASSSTSTLAPKLKPSESADRRSAAPAAPTASADDQNKMKAAIMKQKASGNWDLASAAALVGATVSQLQTQLKKHSGKADFSDLDLAETVFATALICRFFEQKLASERLTWNLVVKKARVWISKQKATLGTHDWSEIARRALQDV